jgi:hypothetical protein
VPPLPAVAAVVRVALIGSSSVDTDIVTRFYIKYAGTAPTNAQLNTFCTAVATAWATDMIGLTQPNYTLIEVTAEDLSSSTAAIGSSVVSHQGTRSGGALPASTAVVVSYTIPRRFRGGHPRGYWNAGSDTDLQTPGTWTSAFLSSMATGISAFYTAVIAAGWTGSGALAQVAVSYYKGFANKTGPTGRAYSVPTINPSGPVVDGVGGYIIRPDLGTQRRRNQYKD